MKRLLCDSSGSFSVETAIVLSSLCIVFSALLSFVLGMFSGINELCEKGIDYSGYLPAVIHRFANVVFETGGELFEKIS
ncbi:MAG: hypothetical protein IJZ94_02185 [Clostridia bacterium]|nr:hypothetical protein [Clostridia bacterium]